MLESSMGSSRCGTAATAASIIGISVFNQTGGWYRMRSCEAGLSLLYEVDRWIADGGMVSFKCFKNSAVVVCAVVIMIRLQLEVGGTRIIYEAWG